MDGRNLSYLIGNNEFKVADYIENNLYEKTFLNIGLQVAQKLNRLGDVFKIYIGNDIVPKDGNVSDYDLMDNEEDFNSLVIKFQNNSGTLDIYKVKDFLRETDLTKTMNDIGLELSEKVNRLGDVFYIDVGDERLSKIQLWEM